jgi:hypothetical protein
MPQKYYDTSDFFTLWCSYKWSAALGVVMLFVSLGDVTFTLLNVAKFGIEGEVNPLAKFMIGAGQTMTALWIVLNVVSTMLIYAFLISFYLMQSPQRREGIAATLISAVLAARITIVLYDFTILSYPAVEVTSAVLALGVILMLSIRFTMKHGENASFGDVEMALRNLAGSIKSSVVSFFSAIAGHPLAALRTRKQKRVETKLSDRDLPKNRRREQEEIDAERGERRRPGRIAIIVVSLIAVPLIIIGALQVVKDISGIENLPRFLMQGNTPETGGIQGTVFLVGFILSIATVGIMVFLILSLFKELSRGRSDV